MSEMPPADSADQPRFGLLPEIRDPRTAEELRADQERTRAQREALEADHDEPGGVNDILRDLVKRRNAVAGESRTVDPVQPLTVDGDGGGEGGDSGGPGQSGDDGGGRRVVLIVPDVIIVSRADLEARTATGPYPAGRGGVQPAGDAEAEREAPEEPSADVAPAPAPESAARRPADLPADVFAVLTELGYVRDPVDPGELVIRFVRVPPEDEAPPSDEERARRTQDDARRLRERTGLGFGVTYVTTLGQIIKGSDHALPSSSKGLIPPPVVREFVGSTPVRIAVIDTGIPRARRRDLWLAGVPRQLATFPVIDTVYLPADKRRIDFGGGHGGFVAGIIEQVCPGADVVAYQAVGSDGFGNEEVVADAILQAAKDGARLINVSLGVNTVDDEPPVALRAAIEALARRFPDTLVVASAGNQGETRPMYPAAFKQVVAVGALGDDGRPTTWSNFGWWVDCSTVGSGVTSTFVPGVLPTIPRPSDPDVTFGRDPWALWTGTSFAAPQITAAVARLVQLSRGAMTPRKAFESLMGGRPTLPGFGHTLRILPGTPD